MARRWLLPVCQQGGAASAATTGSAVAPPTNNNRLGVPGPADPIRPVLACPSMASATWAGVRSGCAARTSAAAPATCGVAIEEPLMNAHAVSPVTYADRIFTPGANRSEHG